MAAGALAELLQLSSKTHFLDLSDRVVKGEDVRALARVLTDRTHNLTSLNLSNVKINADDAMILAKALEFNISLRHLSFEHNPLGYVGVAALAEAVKLNTSVTAFSLADTLLNASGAALIASALYTNATLTSLHMESNRVGAEGARHLAHALAVNQSLRVLDIEGNGIGDAGAFYLAPALAANTALTRLNLRHNGIGADGAAALGEALGANTTLQSLALARLELSLPLLRGAAASAAAASSGIGAGVAPPAAAAVLSLSNSPLSAELDYPVIMPLVARNAAVTRLALAGAGLCGIAPDGRGRRALTGARALACALAAHGAVTALDLRRNFIDDAAVAVLAEGARALPALTALNLSSNDIRAAGAAALCAALSPALTDLNLANNPALGAGGAAAIGALLLGGGGSGGSGGGSSGGGGSVATLNLSNCGLGSEGVAALARGVGGSAALEVLNLEHNAVGRAGKGALGAALLVSRVSRLKGLAMCDGWSIVPGQRALAVKPAAAAAAVAATDEDVMLLAGARSLGIESVSLQHCAMEPACAKPLLELIRDKPGVRVLCDVGNALGDDAARQLQALNAANAQALEPDWSQSAVETAVTVHLLGDAGAGKTALRRALQRGYWESYFTQNGQERATDLGDAEASERTRGVAIERWQHAGGMYSLWDHGGLTPVQTLLSHGAASCAHAVYVVVVSLALPRARQRTALRQWLGVVGACAPAPPSAAALIVVGSRADQLGGLGQEYLDKLWEGVRAEGSSGGSSKRRELPPLRACIALDSRKSQAHAMGRLRSALTQARETFKHDDLAPSPRLAAHALELVARWQRSGTDPDASAGDGAQHTEALPWPEFLRGLRRDLWPRLPESAARDVARTLHATGAALWAERSSAGGGGSGGGGGWVLLALPRLLGGLTGELLLRTPARARARGLPVATLSDLEQLAERFAVRTPVAVLAQLLQDLQIAAEITIGGAAAAAPAVSDGAHGAAAAGAAGGGGGDGVQGDGAHSRGSSRSGSTSSSSSSASHSSAQPPDAQSRPCAERQFLIPGALYEGPPLPPGKRPVWETGGGPAAEDRYKRATAALAQAADEGGRVVAARRLRFGGAGAGMEAVPGAFARVQAAVAQRYCGGVVLPDGLQLVAALEGMQVLLQWAHSGTSSADGDEAGGTFVDVAVAAADAAAAFSELGELKRCIAAVLAQFARLAWTEHVVSSSAFAAAAPPPPHRRVTLPLQHVLAAAVAADAAGAAIAFGEGADAEEVAARDLVCEADFEVQIDSSSAAATAHQNGHHAHSDSADAAASGAVRAAADAFLKRGAKAAMPGGGGGATAANPFYSPPTRRTNPFADTAVAAGGQALNPFRASPPAPPPPAAAAVASAVVESLQLQHRALSDGSLSERNISSPLRDADGGGAGGSSGGGGGEAIEPRVPPAHSPSSSGSSADSSSGGSYARSEIELVNGASPPPPDAADPADVAAAAAAAAAVAVRIDDAFLSEPSIMFRPTLGARVLDYGRPRFELLLPRPGGLKLAPYDADAGAAGQALPATPPPSPLPAAAMTAAATAAAAVLRVALVTEVLDDTVVTGFNVAGTESPFFAVGAVVAGVSREPWGVAPGALLSYKEVVAALDPAAPSTVYPLFVQLTACPPAAAHHAQHSGEEGRGDGGSRTPSRGGQQGQVDRGAGGGVGWGATMPPLRLAQNRHAHNAQVLVGTNRKRERDLAGDVLVGTNRKRERDLAGDVIYGPDLAPGGAPLQWALLSIAFAAALPELGGAAMFVDTGEYTLVGTYVLTAAAAAALLRGHPARRALVYVHGFNNSLTHAARTAGLFARALHSPLTVLLSWPSDPQQTGRGWLLEKVMSAYERSYTRCEHNMHASVRPFVQAALFLARMPQAITWSAHSMGCYLLLNVMDRLQYESGSSGLSAADIFSRVVLSAPDVPTCGVVLSAPDVPTWFFTSTVAAAASRGVRICHYYHPDDQATEASKKRRATEGPCPGNAAVLIAEGVETVDCSGARSASIGANVSLNHDYGRCDGYCLLDQREFLEGEPPEQRVLDAASAGGSAPPQWRLVTSRNSSGGRAAAMAHPGVLRRIYAASQDRNNPLCCDGSMQPAKVATAMRADGEQSHSKQWLTTFLPGGGSGGGGSAAAIAQLRTLQGAARSAANASAFQRRETVP
ncbi:hypothetical protein JKP88DRAFT_293618 [Tribonema minus]|uniref:C-terminal of Roc (COR) domain-containing protein n=1 Tax=Tribonema minus TaxID=303371 RepID=A0A835ZHN6_9STRA|nr:hypothetical protein JKP88DRAFT_293618 [Tribonema minus]